MKSDLAQKVRYQAAEIKRLRKENAKLRTAVAEVRATVVGILKKWPKR